MEKETEKNHARTAAKHFQEVTNSLNTFFEKGRLKNLTDEEKCCLQKFVCGLEHLSWAVLSLQEDIYPPKES